MNSRSGTPSVHTRGSSTAAHADEVAPVHRSRLLAAIGLGGGGALLTGVVPVLGLVSPPTPPGFTSWPLLLVLAVLPPALSLLFLRRRRSVAAAAVLLGAAALAPGRLVIDAQLLVDAGLAVRPELLLPRDLDPLDASIGAWFLLAADVAAGLAGILAASATTRTHASGGGDLAVGNGDRPAEVPRRQGLLAAVLSAAALGAAGVLMAQFSSAGPYLLPGAALDSPLLVLAGTLLVALALPSAAGFAVSSSDPEVARGGLIGLAAATAGLSLTPVISAMLTPQLSTGWGAWTGVLAVVALAFLAVPAGRHGTSQPVGEVHLPALARLHSVAGVLALLSGVLAIAAALVPQLSMPPGLPEFTPYAARLLLPAGAVLVVLGAAMFVPRWSVRARPALTTAWACVPLAALATLDTVLTAAQAAGAHVGAGTWFAVLAVLIAVLAALAAAVAGAVERDEVDVAELPLKRVVLAPAAVSGGLALGAFSLPVLTAPDYSAPGVFTEFDTTSWGLVAGLLVVLAAAALAPVCRGPRSVALLAGAASVVCVRVLELPLTAGRAEGSAAGAGLWCGLACLAALVVTAVLAHRDRS